MTDSAQVLHVGVMGLGLVGLPTALSIARRHATTGYDVDHARVALLRDAHDPLGTAAAHDLRASSLRITDDPAALAPCNVVLVTVPVLADAHARVDTAALEAACATLGAHMRPGTLVVLESTGWPGMTEEVCIPALERASGLRCGNGFQVAYSPERINPADAAHAFGLAAKVVSAPDDASLQRALAFYRTVVDAPLHAAPSVRVAEAGKLVENAQRDVNIALANELSQAFARMGLSARDVFEAAATKWNFAPYRPGLVGGACVGLAPRLLEHAARDAGASLELLGLGRALHDGMVSAVVDRVLRLCARARITVSGARVGVLGCTYKADVADARNSRVPLLVRELRGLGMDVLVHDPVAHPGEVLRHQAETLVTEAQMRNLDVIVLAVGHAALGAGLESRVAAMLRPGGACLDLAWRLDARLLPATVMHENL